MDIKTKIRIELIEVGLTISSLEKKLGMGRGAIQQMLDRGSLRYDVAEKIAKFLGKDIKWVKKNSSD